MKPRLITSSVKKQNWNPEGTVPEILPTWLYHYKQNQWQRSALAEFNSYWEWLWLAACNANQAPTITIQRLSEPNNLPNIYSTWWKWGVWSSYGWNTPCSPPSWKGGPPPHSAILEALPLISMQCCRSMLARIAQHPKPTSESSGSASSTEYNLVKSSHIWVFVHHLGHWQLSAISGVPQVSHDLSVI